MLIFFSRATLAAPRLPNEVLIGAIATIASVVASISSLAYWLGRKFASIDARFKVIDERFKLMDERFRLIDERFKSTDEKFKSIDGRFDELKRYIDVKVGRLAAAFTNYQEFLVEFLTGEGVIKPAYRELLVREARRTVELAAVDPLSKEEWGRLKEYLDRSERDELTLEEADEFLELARKVVKEHGERPEAWRLHIYAAMTRALTIRRHYEREGREERR
jgi:hypothetical protein